MLHNRLECNNKMSNYAPLLAAPDSTIRSLRWAILRKASALSDKPSGTEFCHNLDSDGPLTIWPNSLCSSPSTPALLYY